MTGWPKKEVSGGSKKVEASKTAGLHETNVEKSNYYDIPRNIFVYFMAFLFVIFLIAPWMFKAGRGERCQIVFAGVVLGAVSAAILSLLDGGLDIHFHIIGGSVQAFAAAAIFIIVLLIFLRCMLPKELREGEKAPTNFEIRVAVGNLYDVSLKFSRGIKVAVERKVSELKELNEKAWQKLRPQLIAECPGYWVAIVNGIREAIDPSESKLRGDYPESPDTLIRQVDKIKRVVYLGDQATSVRRIPKR